MILLRWLSLNFPVLRLVIAAAFAFDLLFGAWLPEAFNAAVIGIAIALLLNVVTRGVVAIVASALIVPPLTIAYAILTGDRAALQKSTDRVFLGLYWISALFLIPAQIFLAQYLNTDFTDWQVQVVSGVSILLAIDFAARARHEDKEATVWHDVLDGAVVSVGAFFSFFLLGIPTVLMAILLDKIFGPLNWAQSPSGPWYASYNLASFALLILALEYLAAEPFVNAKVRSDRDQAVKHERDTVESSEDAA